MALPGWLRIGERPNTFYIDPDIIYQEWMDLLNLTYETLDHYWYEVIFQCAKMDAVSILQREGLLNHDTTPVLIFDSKKVVDENGKVHSKWHLSNFPKGAGTMAAINDRAAKKIYKTIRGELEGWTTLD